MSDTASPPDLKSVLEAVIFASGEPLSESKLLELIEPAPTAEEFNQAIEQLRSDYADRAVQLVEVAAGYQFRVSPGHAEVIHKLWLEKPRKYSRTLLETLAIIAYRQPVTRGDIEQIRGVSINAKVINTLLDRNWIRTKGYADTPGRPAWYVTTQEFLNYFGLRSLDNLPALNEIRSLDDMNNDEAQNLKFAEDLQAALQQARAEAIAAQAEATADEVADESAPVEQPHETDEHQEQE